MLSLLLVTLPVNAGVGGYTNGRVFTVYVYSAFGGGDVIITTTNMGAPCDAGFRLRPTAGGFDASLSTELSDYHANSMITVYAHNENAFGHDRWSGSQSGWFCRIDSIGILK